MHIVTSVGMLWFPLWHAGHRERSQQDLGDAPIGSDPWLRAEVSAALGRDPLLPAGAFLVEVVRAVVTIRGVTPAHAVRVERAARTVEGIATLRLEPTR